MKENGSTTIWMETEAGRRLQRRLNQENTLSSIDHLLDRLDTLEQAVDRLADLLNQGPGLISMVADTTDELIREAQHNGVDLTERIQNTLVMAEKLTSKETTEKLNQLMELTDQLPGLVAMGMDTVDEASRELADSGIDFTALAKIAATSGKALSEAQNEPIKPVSAFGVFRAMKDKDRQKGLGFLMNFLKKLGQEI